jgi:ABC-type branched-subunit amino acid transport system substrate-binding protein
VTAKTEPLGIKTVYTALVPVDAVDMSSYLTKIRYVNPDVLVMGLYTPQAMTVAKQIIEQGGWGNIQVLAITGSDQASRLQGSWGWIVETAWAGTQSTYPASVQFVEDFKAANKGQAPNINHIWFYTPVWTIIQAIEQTGTDDRATIAQYARSGKLQWDTPLGMAHFTPDGNSGLDFSYIRILQGGKTAPFE